MHRTEALGRAETQASQAPRHRARWHRRGTSCVDDDLFGVEDADHDVPEAAALHRVVDRRGQYPRGDAEALCDNLRAPLQKSIL
eukprot:scaffold88861_cov60-Phaeocystis_antarctica.AAC.5